MPTWTWFSYDIGKVYWGDKPSPWIIKVDTLRLESWDVSWERQLFVPQASLFVPSTTLDCTIKCCSDDAQGSHNSSNAYELVSSTRVAPNSTGKVCRGRNAIALSSA